MTLPRIKKEQLPDQVFAILKQSILDGEYKVGDKLPSEASLSESLGVGKASIRVAIQRLVAFGLVETRPGDGSYISTPKPMEYLEQIKDFLLSDQDVSNIMEYRMAMEMAVIRIAVKRATEENYRRMEKYLDGMDKALEDDDVERHEEYDNLFHRELCNATQNDVFILAYDMLGEMLRQHISVVYNAYIRANKDSYRHEDVHRQLYEAIRAGNLEICHERLKDMFAVLL